MKNYIIKNIMGDEWFYWGGGNNYTLHREEAKKNGIKRFA